MNLTVRVQTLLCIRDCVLSNSTVRPVDIDVCPRSLLHALAHRVV